MRSPSPFKIGLGENKEMSTGSNFNTSTVVYPDSIKIHWKWCKFSNSLTGKLKLLFKIFKPFDFTMLMYCAIGKISQAAKCFQEKIYTINKKSLL